MNGRRIRAGLAALAVVAVAALLAEDPRAAEPAAGGPRAAERPVDRLDPAKDIGFDQKLGAAVPLDAVFRDESGAEVRFGDYFKGKPVILSLAYYGCPMLCGLALQGLASSLKPLAFEVGREFEVVTVSFDPRETPDLAREKKPGFVDLYGREGAADGWHFLTGDQESIRRLTESVGFRYAWDESEKQYAHATGIVMLTPDGRVSRYFFGVEYAPKDLRLGLIETADGTIGGIADRLLLLCYHYDPQIGRYSAAAMNLVRLGAFLVVALLGSFVIVMLRRERRARAAGAERREEAP